MEDVEVLGAQINLMIKQIGNFSQALCHIFEEWHDLKYITWCGTEVFLRQGLKDKSCPGQENRETRTRFHPSTLTRLIAVLDIAECDK